MKATVINWARDTYLSWKSEDLTHSDRFEGTALAYFGGLGFLLFKNYILETLNISFLLLL